VTEAIGFAQHGDTTSFEWHVTIFRFLCFSVLGLVLTANNTTAQTIGYRQTNLASNLPNVGTTKIQDFSSCSFCLSSFPFHFRYLK
jgi:hypothetical protein